MKFHLIFIIILISNFSYSQEIYWNSNLFPINEIHSNGFSLFNKSKQTVKFTVGSSTYLIEPNSKKSIYFPGISEFNRNNINLTPVKIIYDDDCFSNDLDLINEEINDRRFNKFAGNVLKELAYEGFKYMVKDLKENSNDDGWIPVKTLATKVDKAIELKERKENVKEIIEMGNHISEYGFDNRSKMYLLKLIKDKSVESINNENLNHINKGIDIYFNASSDLEVDTRDLDYRIYLLSNLISKYPKLTYPINYDLQIKPYVDYDNDEITNKYDSICPRSSGQLWNGYESKWNGCPKSYFDSDNDGINKDYDKCDNDYGPARTGRNYEYSGCSDKEMKRLKKIKRDIKKEEIRKNLGRFYYIDLNYAYSQLGIIDDNEYTNNLSNSSLFANLSIPVLRHSISKNTASSFALDISYLSGKTSLKNNEQTQNGLFIKSGFTGGISYILLLNKNAKNKIILQPRIGTTLSEKVSKTEIQYSDGTTDVIDDLFIIEDEKQNLYYDLILRVRNLNTIGFQIGARYQQNSNIKINPNYDDLIDYSVGGNEYIYPKKTIMFFGGINMTF